MKGNVFFSTPVDIGTAQYDWNAEFQVDLPGGGFIKSKQDVHIVSVHFGEYVFKVFRHSNQWLNIELSDGDQDNLGGLIGK